MNITAIASALLIAVAMPFAVQAGPYGPFSPDENYGIALHTCEGVQDIRQSHPPLGNIEFSRPDTEQQLRITMVGTSHYEAQVFSRDSALGPHVKVPVQATMPSDVGLDDAVCHDLNSDGATDFVVTLWGHGNGFGASFYDRLVALSTGASYRFWVVPTVGPAAEDFVTFGQIEPMVMVSRQFVQKRDWPQEPRSYFVYDLWAFHRDELVLANSIDSRFPKWVRYTLKPNWRPAVSLTDADKRRLRSDPRPVEAIP